MISVELNSTFSSEEVESIDSVTETESSSSPIPCTMQMKRARLEILTPRLSAVLDKCKISDRDAVHLLTACVEATSLNPLDFVINRTSIRLSRQRFRELNAFRIKQNFFDLNLKFITIHWDSKILLDITGKTKVDRLPIIATAPNTEQLLGVPELSAGTGYEVSSAVYDTLEDWLLLDSVQAFVFDTTASNTGRLNGACVLLEHKLGRNILYLACRHHVFEIILQSVFVGSKFAPSSGPDIPLFKRFKNQWKTIDLTQFSIWSMDVKTSNVLNDVRQQILIFAHEKLRDDFPRDDYKEFLELIVIFLGDVPPGGIKFRQPGPYHLARWMAKGIYCLKIILFQKQFKLSVGDKKALQTICCFIVKCYAESWFTAPDAVQAPLNDIIFIKKLNSYKKDDKIIAEIALNKFLNHLWYLNEECAAFSLFDDRINVKQKRNMVQKILEEDKEEEKEVQKKFYLKSEEVSNFVNNELPTSLLSAKSMMMFKRFGLSTNFLKIDPSEWNTQNDYIQGQQIIRSLKVVNDTAERGVKLMEEFNEKITKDEDQKQFLLKVSSLYK